MTKHFVPPAVFNPYAIHSDEIIIDSFAGGGGASKGIEMALGRSPDIAINHNALAIAMHRRNHPKTRHLTHDIWKTNIVKEVAGRKVGLLWASPDCRMHSKARGGPVTSKRSRDLAWVIIQWAQLVNPRIIALENVEEWKDWCDLDPDGEPIAAQKGETFQKFVRELERIGYVVQYRIQRACDYGAPTIRKRLFLIARRDGGLITWSDPTHADPKDLRVQAGLLKPFRTAAECLDWTIPTPSIFLSREEGRAVGAQRPLAPNTMKRTFKGVMRYVVNNPKPYLVSLTHQGGDRTRPINLPFQTITGANRGEIALAAPVIAKFRHDQAGSAVDAPMPTVTANSFKKRPGGAAPLGLIAPVLASVAHGDSGGRREYPVDEPTRTIVAGGITEALVTPILAPHISYAQQGGGNRAADVPLHTICASPKDQNVVVTTKLTPATDADHSEHGRLSAPYFVARYGERPGQEPRTRSVEEPAATVVRTANGDNLCQAELIPLAAHIQSQYGHSVGADIDEPMATIMAGGGGKHALVAAYLGQQNTDRIGHPADEPVSTIVANGCKQSVVATFLGQQNTGLVGHSPEEPLSTIVQKGCTQTVCAAHLSHFYTSNTAGGEGDLEAPMKTITAGGNHAGLVAAFLQKYYTEADPAQAADTALHTITAKGRFGLVTVQLAGEPYVIVDIGMRMLQPKELFLAQGFPPDYVFEIGLDEHGHEVKLTKTAQIGMCGNSVSPPHAASLIAAQFPDSAQGQFARAA